MSQKHRGRRGALLASLFLSIAYSPALLGQQELITDRPDQTESAVTVAPGQVQIEAGALFESHERESITTERLEIPGTLLRIGLVQKLELRIAWTGWIDEEIHGANVRARDDGPGDAGLGIKLKLREESGRAPETALLLGANLPTGHRAFTSDRLDPEIRVALSHTLSDRIGLGYNVGLTFEEGAGGSGTVTTALYTLASGFTLSDRWGAFVELFGYIPASAAGKPATLVDGGFTRLLTETLQLDVAGGVGLSDSAIDWFAGIGISVRLPN
jgi:hypothetical protein